jgi:hypothetical protein
MDKLLCRIVAGLRVHRPEIAGALGVERCALAAFVAGRTLSPAWLPLALDAYVRAAVRTVPLERMQHYLGPAAEMVNDLKTRRREDLEYARQWAEDRASMPPELERLAV